MHHEAEPCRTGEEEDDDDQEVGGGAQGAEHHQDGPRHFPGHRLLLGAEDGSRPPCEVPASLACG